MKTTSGPTGNQDERTSGNVTKSLMGFLNSSLGLLLVGALVGAIGLFTWQRMDWLFKQEHLRAQVLLDRKIGLVERINADVGAFVACAGDVVAVFEKGFGESDKKEVLDTYNQQELLWFGDWPSHKALLGLYFPPSIAIAFEGDIVQGTKNLDVQVYKYTKDASQENRRGAWQAWENVLDRLQNWNELVSQYI